MGEENMEDLKQSKKTFSRLGFSYIAGTVALYVLQILMVACVFNVKPEWQENINIQLLLSCVITYGISMPLIVLLARRLPASAPEPKKMKMGQFLIGLIMCYSMVYLSNLIGTMITTFIGEFKGSEVQNELANTVTNSNPWINLLVMVILAPIVEEYVFRKVIVDRTRQYGSGMAIAASALMFGLFHGNLNQFAYAVVLGAFFSFLYLRTGKLRVTIAMHAVVNFMGGIVAPAILNLMDYEQLQKLDPENQAQMLDFFMDNVVGIMFAGLFLLVLIGVVFAGFILTIVSLKKFKTDPVTDGVPEGKRFNVLIVNPGMLTFCVVWLALIVYQLTY